MDQSSAGTVEISGCPWLQNEISSVFFLASFPRALAQLIQRGPVWWAPVLCVRLAGRQGSEGWAWGNFFPEQLFPTDVL